MQFEQLGPYRLGKKLGQGGMGAVYEGVDADTGQAAAIKVLAPRLALDDGFRVRFEAEIESLKKLRHPNIVRLFGYGEQGGTLFYAMELVPGTSLEDELRRGRRFTWREVTQVAIKLCRALKHAHDHGVIHRDLKPANLLLTTDGEIKLSDFGIARLFGNTRLTSDGGVLGTAEYMAPEQADGRPVTDRCDQYSLGGVMYTLLAGRPPFRAETLVEMLQLQRYAEPEPIQRLAPDTPEELARIVHQLLEKDPQKRFPNALMLARALEAMERGLSLSVSRAGTKLVVSTDDPDLDGGEYNPLAPTLSPTQLAEAERRAAGESVGPATAATMAYAPAEQAARVTPDEPAADRFTKVAERRDESHPLRELLTSLVSPQTLALAAALAALVGAAWYFLRPLDADALYERIESASRAGDPDQLKSATADMQTFLERFPNDPRADEVQSLADEAEQSGPIARAYAEAKRSMLFNPELAQAKFQALIDVYDEGAGGSQVAQKYVRLARVQQKRLARRVDAYVAEGRKLIDARLAKAAALVETDPAAARRIYEGVIELYRDKTWATEQVRQAETALRAAAAPQTASD